VPFKERRISTFQHCWFALVPCLLSILGCRNCCFYTFCLGPFDFAEVSASRKKVDVQSLDPQHMQNHVDRVGHKGTDTSESESEFNLRKSLAWDSAFFTSPGLLPRLTKTCLTSAANCCHRMKVGNVNVFCASTGVLDPEELETISIRVVDNGVDTAGGGDLRSVPSRSAGPEGKSAIDECSLRKSLAWDSAFFTSSGDVVYGLEVSVKAPYVNQCLFFL
jgi:hypothetical protein